MARTRRGAGGSGRVTRAQLRQERAERVDLWWASRNSKPMTPGERAALEFNHVRRDVHHAPPGERDAAWTALTAWLKQFRESLAVTDGDIHGVKFTRDTSPR